MSTGSTDLGRAPELPASPLRPSQRIDAIDVLRGLALFGVLAVNIVTEFRVSIFEQLLPTPSAVPPLDRAVESFLTLALQMKALALFSLLFGAGLAIQFDRLAGDPRRTTLLVRRLVVLLAFGLAHLFLIWNGDILAEYALAGLVVLPFLFGPRWLLAAAATLFLGLYLLMPLLSVALLPDTNSIVKHVGEARQIYGSGGFWEILLFRIREVPSILPLHVLIFPRTVSLFLFGAFIWRTGILRHASASRPWLLGAAIAGVVIGGGLTLASVGYGATDWPLPGRGLFPARDLAPVLLAIGYGAVVIGLMTFYSGRRMMGWAAPLGRMAFTNYLVQSVVFGWVFYGYGLGLFGRLGAAAALAIGIAVYAAQVMFSMGWLNRYQYGPVEWLWRTLMYGALQPMRRAAGERELR